MGDSAHGKALINAMAEAMDSYREHFDFAVKYQFRELDPFIHPDYKGSDLKFVKRFEETVLTDDEWQELIDCGRDNGFMLIITPFDEPSVARTLKFGGHYQCQLLTCGLAASRGNSECRKAGNIFHSRRQPGEHRQHGFLLRQPRCQCDHDALCRSFPTPYEQLNIGQIALQGSLPGSEDRLFHAWDPSLTSTGGTAFCLGARVFEKHVALETDTYGKNAYSASGEPSTWLNELQQTVR